MNLLVATDIDPTNVIGGSERALVGQIVELCKRGHRVTVVTRSQEGKASEETTPYGCAIRRYPMPSGTGAAELVRALAAIKRAVAAAVKLQRPDVIYIQQPMSGAGVMLDTVSRSIGTVYQFHSPWCDEYRLRLPHAARFQAAPDQINLSRSQVLQFKLRKFIEGSVLNRSKRILTLSAFMRDRCIELHGINSSKFEIIPGGVQTDHFRPSSRRYDVRRELGYEDWHQLILTVRNLEPRMGISNMLEATAMLAPELPNLRCLIGGSGELLESLKTYAAELKLDNIVKFTGFIPEAMLPEIYSACDLFILPTTALEGFGLVTVEALSCGAPVVGTPIGATPEILSPLRLDLVLPDASPSSIATAVKGKLALTEGQRVQMRERCREYAVENYSWATVVDRVERILSCT